MLTDPISHLKESEGVFALQLLHSTIDGWLVALPHDFLHLKRAYSSQRLRQATPTSAVCFAFLSDFSRPSLGGILVITAEKAREIKDLPPGNRYIIIGSTRLDLSEFSEPFVLVVGQSEMDDSTPLSQPSSDAYPGDPAIFSDVILRDGSVAARLLLRSAFHIIFWQ
ncbi:hypothetical protein BDZ89DRAFT_481873 [Hymenopellis radicata]|nr:hypothetical protein BDZ89DRAFT_481873 [Hymenopellis radicata]